METSPPVVTSSDEEACTSQLTSMKAPAGQKKRSVVRGEEGDDGEGRSVVMGEGRSMVRGEEGDDGEGGVW